MSHESPLHLLADSLIDYFDSSEAVNYIEQTFACNHDSSKSFVITMQKVEGLTPCEKLAKAESLNADMYEVLERIIGNYQVLASIAGQNGIMFDEYAQDSKDTEFLLKRARGE